MKPLKHTRSSELPDDSLLIRAAQSVLVALMIGLPSFLVLALMSAAFGLFWATR